MSPDIDAQAPAIENSALFPKEIISKTWLGSSSGPLLAIRQDCQNTCARDDGHRTGLNHDRTIEGASYEKVSSRFFDSRHGFDGCLW